jgi:hypothetical protein
MHIYLCLHINLMRLVVSITNILHIYVVLRDSLDAGFILILVQLMLDVVLFAHI